MIMEEERRVITPEDIAREMYNPERMEIPETSPPSIEGVWPPDDTEEREMSLAEWRARGLATAPLPEKYTPGLSQEGLRTIVAEVELEHPDVFNKYRVDLEHFEEIISEGYDSHVRGVGLKPTVSPNFCTSKKLLKPSFLVLHKWITSKFVAGPFEEPPVSDPKIIGLLFVPKETAGVRLVMDMSKPKHFSFNDGISKDYKSRYELQIAQASDVLERIREMGPDVWMAKCDIRDAYKRYSIHPDQWRLQCFRFFGLYFLDYKMVFGDSKCVHTFSHNHLLLIRAAVLPYTNLSSRNFFLCIDDLTVLVRTHQLQEGRKFLARYKYVMELVGFQLQDFDERRFKSFDFARSGLVLGVFVDIPRQLWYFVDQKRRRWAAALEEILVEGTVCPDQRRFDDLMGRLENLATIMPELVLRTARVRSILTDPKNKRGQLRKAEEHIRWVRALMRLFADGAISFARQSQVFKDQVIIHGDASGSLRSEYVPCAGVLMQAEDGGRAAALQFPRSFLMKNFGYEVWVSYRTTLLEIFPAFALILLQPHRFQDKDITVVTDNENLVLAWIKKRSRDRGTLIAMEALSHCCRMLRADLHFIWKRRCSDEPSTIVDLLSHGDLRRAVSFLPEGQVVHCAWPQPLSAYMRADNPEDVDLPKMIEEFWFGAGKQSGQCRKRKL